MTQRSQQLSFSTRLIASLILLFVKPTESFAPCVAKAPLQLKSSNIRVPTTALHSFFNKNNDDDEDLSFIETRDMTREEMAEYNRRFEDTVNQEMIGMTVFSLIISLPLLYLAWVGLFSETAEIASDFSDLPYN